MDAAASAKRIRLQGSSACPLPEEIVEDILSRLPARSLRRFQCVSRWFHAVIASRSFQDAHFQRNSGKRRLFIKPTSFQEPFYAWQPGGPFEKITRAGQLPQGSIFPLAAKSCHGLILLSCLEYHTHYVWNPSTSDLLTLPDRIPLRAARCTYTANPLVSYGLGYCSATRQHKVVRMYYVHDYRGAASISICEVFALNESAYWRPAAKEPPLHYPRENWRQGAVFCNGNLHFLQEDGGITTFNVRDETFGMLKHPPELQCCSNFELTELCGCLCAYTFTEWWNLNQDSEYPCDVWLLRDYAADGSWEKLCCINWGTIPEPPRAYLKSSWIAPLDIYNDDNSKKIMFHTGSCNVLVVDPSIGTPEILYSTEDVAFGEFDNDQLPAMGLFEESLALVGNTSENTTFSSPSMQAWSEVLSRLPACTVGSVIQVCKGWRAMIKTERFATAHLYNANLNKSPQMMFLDGKPSGFVPVKNFVNTPYVPPLIDDGLRLVCSKPCHGLNAGSFANYDFVCNPVTGYFKALPLNDWGDWKGLSLHDFLSQVPWHCNVDAMFAGRLGLGYEQETSRHVLARLEYKERNLATRDYKLVCNMRYVEDMFWNEVDPPSRPIANTPPAYVNGKLYWMVDTELGQRSLGQEIIVLDVSKRKFEVLQGPPCIHHHNDRVFVFELQDVVCVACSHHSTDTIQIWAMEDNGSWSTEYRIELGRFLPEYSTELVTVLAVNPMDGKILLSTGRALGYYDPKTTELETVYRLGKHIKGKKFIPVLFQESLINPCDPIF